MRGKERTIANDKVCRRGARCYMSARMVRAGGIQMLLVTMRGDGAEDGTVRVERITFDYRGRALLWIDGQVGKRVPSDNLNSIDLERRNAELREVHPNAGTPWTREEDERLTQETSDGTAVSALAEELGRSRGAITSRQLRLGLIREGAELPRRRSGRYIPSARPAMDIGRRGSPTQPPR